MINIKFWFLLLVSATVSAQEKAKDTINYQPRQQYIQSMDQFITLKLTQSSDVETFGVETKTNRIQL